VNKAEQLVRQADRYILGLAATYRGCWEAACRHDGLDPQCTLAVFSDENPYIPYLHRIYQQYQEALAAYQVWGYVGQRLSSCS